MGVTITYAYSPFFSDTGKRGRVVRGVFLHSTETPYAVIPRAEGSFHYEIDRDGTTYQFVDDLDIAWHVRACDEHWPAWLPHTQPFPPSVPNCHSIGIELVSNATYRAAGIPYTDAQYAVLQELLAHIQARWGTLPIDTHGRVQLDRTDPVALDYARAGLVWDPALDAYRTGDDMATNAELQAALDQCNGINTELQSQVDALRAEIIGLNGVNTQLNAQWQNCEQLKQQVEADLRTEIDRLNAELAAATAAGGAAPPRYVEVTTTDGVVHPFVPEGTG